MTYLCGDCKTEIMHPLAVCPKCMKVPSSVIISNKMADANEEEIEIVISSDGKKLWINGVSDCLCRVQGIKRIRLKDSRTLELRLLGGK